MGRSITDSLLLSSTGKFTGKVNRYLIPAGYLGVFGSGRWKVFYVNGFYTVPASVTNLRIRVIGGGGGAVTGSTGGAGGGYAHGVFTVSPGTVYEVTVGSSGSFNTGSATATPGGISSFGNLILATGGGPGSGGAVSPTPGIGIGGDFQAKGGTSVQYGGGGAAGSQLGDGGSALVAYSGGAGVGGGDALGSGGGSAFGRSIGVSPGPDITDNYNYNNGHDISQPGGSIDGPVYLDSVLNSHVSKFIGIIRFPFDGFTGGGGFQNTEISRPFRKISIGGTGAGGGVGRYPGSRYAFGGDGGVGGGGGAIRATNDGTANGDLGPSYCGNGGFGGGAGSGASSFAMVGANGGRGLVIVEW